MPEPFWWKRGHPSRPYRSFCHLLRAGVLAWRMSAKRDATFTRAIVHAALRRRRPKPGLIFHSDRGSEFLGTPFRDRLAKSGILQSMTRGGAPDEGQN